MWGLHPTGNKPQAWAPLSTQLGDKTCFWGDRDGASPPCPAQHCPTWLGAGGHREAVPTPVQGCRRMSCLVPQHPYMTPCAWDTAAGVPAAGDSQLPRAEIPHGHAVDRAIFCTITPVYSG